ncbi:MAG: hypothetical protein IKC65_01020, partial [Lentisphaeria bacterium]|nr:hypothetical protein [Lentisphaeria bacterium]
WGISSDNGKAGTTGYYIRYGAAEALSGDGKFVSENSFSLENLDYGSWFYQIRSVDALGNLSDWSERQRFEVIPESPQGLKSSVGSLSWEKHPQAENYTVAMNSGFAGFTLETAETCVDLFGLPGGVWQWQVKVSGWEKSSRGDEIVSEENALRSTRIISDADGYADVFFAAPAGVWERGYSAIHQGFADGWTGIGERVALGGKNKITSVFEGSGDANILVLSNDACGDALFMEDLYSAFPGGEEQPRLARIHEIRSGAGDDIIDLTGQCFAYEGKGMSIYGGAGDDYLWAAACGGRLFGEDGDDFLTGGSGADILCGGAGNDRLHGGGGEDTFVFSGSWGEDTVEQLASGRVILQFSSGSSGNWDAEALVYSDGENKVTVCGVAAEQIQLVFLDAPGS